ncbi:hypothetical protein BKI52_11550 [marine bacterium AO1-C]|nr:hypothetical protein BKI52_11550 [marine bacterium AO1-C]
MKRLIRLFFQGLLVVVPLLLTYYAIYFVFSITYYRINSLITWAKRFEYLPIEVPFLVYVVADIALLVLIGYLASGFITKTFFKWYNRLIFKIPVIRIIYSSIRGFTSAFVGQKRKFDQPVLVKLNPSNLERIGFLVQDDLSKLNIKDKVAVYLPGSYGISGNLVIAPAENITPLETSGLDAMNFIISGGIAELAGVKVKHS